MFIKLNDICMTQLAQRFHFAMKALAGFIIDSHLRKHYFQGDFHGIIISLGQIQRAKISTSDHSFNPVSRNVAE